MRSPLTAALGTAMAIMALAACGSSTPPAVVAAATTSPTSVPTVPPAQLATAGTLGQLATPGPLGPLGPEEIPIPAGPSLAATGFLRPGGIVDGIRCQTHEKFLFHVHTHLAVFVNGAARQIPAAIGIAPPLGIQHKPHKMIFVNNGACFAWLHTHTPDGIIHIESPVQRAFTLGDFFDVWGQPLGPDRVGPFRGPVVAFFDGKRYLGNPRNIPIGYHAEVQLDVGTPTVAPERIKFRGGL